MQFSVHTDLVRSHEKCTCRKRIKEHAVWIYRTWMQRLYREEGSQSETDTTFKEPRRLALCYRHNFANCAEIYIYSSLLEVQCATAQNFGREEY